MINHSCHATIIIGNNQSGKTTFINELCEYFRSIKRYSCTVNFNPSKIEDYDINIGTEFTSYLDEYGPKRALAVYMDKLLEEGNWIEEKLSSKNVKYFIFEMPNEFDILFGVGALPRLIEILRTIGCRICIAFLLDAQFACDPFQFVGGYLYSLSNIGILDIPHINILTKCDLLNEDQIKSLNKLCLNDDDELMEYIPSVNADLRRLTCETFALIRGSNFGRFVQFDLTDQASLLQIVEIIDASLGYVQSDDYEEEEENIEEIMNEMRDQENNESGEDDENAIYDHTVKTIEELGEPKEDELTEQEKWYRMLNDESSFLP